MRRKFSLLLVCGNESVEKLQELDRGFWASQWCFLKFKSGPLSEILLPLANNGEGQVSALP